MQKSLSPETAVQLRQDEELKASVFYGKHARTVAGSRGMIALVGPGRTVLYVLTNGYRKKGYLFRTGGCPGSQVIPGVYPAVRLLVYARTRTMVHRLQTAVRWFEQHDVDLDLLDEAIFSRLQARIEEKKFSISSIRKMLNA